MLEEEKEAQESWQEWTVGRPALQEDCGTEEMEEKVRLLETNLKDILNNYPTQLGITTCFKR